MAHSGRERHRDRAPGHRQLEETALASPLDRVFRITDAERRLIAKCLLEIDEARRALESQHNRENREIVRDLRASADRIYDLINGLDEADPQE